MPHGVLVPARALKPIAAPNNGMHPTADTRAVMLRQRGRAAGDARVRPLLMFAPVVRYTTPRAMFVSSSHMKGVEP